MTLSFCRNSVKENMLEVQSASKVGWKGNFLNSLGVEAAKAMAYAPFID